MVQSNLEEDYRKVFIYRRNGMNETETLVVDIDTAAAALSGGWELSPYEFLPEDRKCLEMQAIVDQIAEDLNAMLNLDFEQSKKVLVDLAWRYLGIKIDKRLSGRNMRRKIREEGRETGKFDDRQFEVLVNEEELVEHDG